MNILLSKKYKPTFLTDIKHNIDLKKCLLNLSKDNELPHILLSGSNNVGKYSFARCFLNSKFNENIDIKKNIFTIDNNPIDVFVSQYHFEIDIKMCKTFQKKSCFIR